MCTVTAAALHQREARRGFTIARGFGISKEVTVAELLDALWRDYVVTTPQAARIQDLLTQRGELLNNDCVGFATFGAPGLGVEAIARPFEAFGWRPRDRYRMRDKHLRA